MILSERTSRRLLTVGACLAAVALSACQTPPPAAPAKTDEVQAQIDRLVSRSAALPPFTNSADAVAPGPRFENGKLWVTFRGDAIDMLKRLEPVTGQAVIVSGPQPRLPLYVQVHAAGLPIDEVYRDIGYQLGQRADLLLQAKGVEIRFRSY